jgi:hypothetical protein
MLSSSPQTTGRGGESCEVNLRKEDADVAQLSSSESRPPAGTPEKYALSLSVGQPLRLHPTKNASLF